MAYNFAEAKRLLPPMADPLETLSPGNTPISPEVRALAQQRGQLDAAGNLDLSGLRLQQDDVEQGVFGYTYVVNQHVEVAGHTYRAGGQRVETIPEQEIVPGEERQWKLRHEGGISILHELGRRMPVARRPANPRRISVIELDVYDPFDRLISKTFYQGLDQFMALLDSRVEKGRRKKEADEAKRGFYVPAYMRTHANNAPLPYGPIKVTGWGKAAPKPPAERPAEETVTVPFPLNKWDGDILGQAFREKEKMALPDDSLVGLTITKIEDTPVSKDDLDWLSSDNKIRRRNIQVTDDFLVYPPMPGGPEMIRAFVVREYEDGRQLERIRRVYGVEDLEKLLDAPVTNRGELDALLASGDFAGLRKKRGAIVDAHWEIPIDAYRKADGTLTSQAGISTSKRQQADRLNKEYAYAANMLGLSSAPTGRAGSNRMLAEINRHGYEHHELVDYRIGLSFIRRAIRQRVEQRPVTANGRDVIGVKKQVTLTLDKKMLARIQNFVKPEVEEIVDRVIDGEQRSEEPRRSDLAYLGRLLRRQIIK